MMLLHELDDPDSARPVWAELSNLRQERFMCDVIFVAMDKTHIHAHGCVLAASSSHLKQTLASHPCIELSWMTGAAIDSMLHFIYTGYLKLEASEINNVAVAAEHLQIESLVKACDVLMERGQGHNTMIGRLESDNGEKNPGTSSARDTSKNNPLGGNLTSGNSLIFNEYASSDASTSSVFHDEQKREILSKKMIENDGISSCSVNTSLNSSSDRTEDDIETMRGDISGTTMECSSNDDVTTSGWGLSGGSDTEREATVNASRNSTDNGGGVTLVGTRDNRSSKVSTDTRQSAGVTSVPCTMSAQVVEEEEASTGLISPNDTDHDDGGTTTSPISDTEIKSSLVEEGDSMVVSEEAESTVETFDQELPSFDDHHKTSQAKSPKLRKDFSPDAVHHSPLSRAVNDSPVPVLILTKDSIAMDSFVESVVTSSSGDMSGLDDPVSGVQDELLDTSSRSSGSGGSTARDLEEDTTASDTEVEKPATATTTTCLAGGGVVEDEDDGGSSTGTEGSTDSVTKEVSYTGDITDDKLLFMEEVAMETDVTGEFTFGDVIGSDTIVEVASGYTEVAAGCQGHHQEAAAVIPLMSCDGLTVVKEEEWMGETRSEELADGTTQYVAVELQVENEGEDGQTRTALVTIPLGQDGVVEKEALQAMFNQTTASSPELKMEAESSSLVYQCEPCEVEFSSLPELRQHMVKAKHQAAQGFVCTECGQRFKYKHNLKNHQLRHLEVKPFVCKHDGCKKQFASKNDLIVHGRSHTGARPYVCDYCNKAFTQSSNLLTHKRSVHNQEFLGGARNFHCPECRKSFKTKDMLNKHMKRHLLAFTCSQCEMKFRTRKDLRSHGLDSHNFRDFLPAREDGEKVELYQCPQCDRVYMDTVRLNEHVTIVHNKEKRFSCPWEGCEYTAYYKYAIQRHYRVHEAAAASSELRPETENVYRCRHCTAPFTGAAGLRFHLKSAHGEGNPPELQVTSSSVTEAQLQLLIKQEKSTSDREDCPPSNSPAADDRRGHVTGSNSGAELGTETSLEKHSQLHRPQRQLGGLRRVSPSDVAKLHPIAQ